MVVYLLKKLELEEGVKLSLKLNNIQSVFNICPECGGQIISIKETGDLICNQCGLVLEEKRVDNSHDGRRAYTTNEKNNRERTGAPISVLLPDLGLTTVIDKSKIKNPDLKRAAKWNTRMSWEKRNILIATTELKRISSKLQLPSHVKKEAMTIYREIHKRNLLQGRSINSMIAACLYYAIRKYRLSRTFQEVLDESTENPKDIRRCYRVILQELNLKAPNTDPVSLIPRYVVDLGLGNDILTIATKIVKTYVSKFSSSGKDPKGIVGGALYIACKLKGLELTQYKIAEIVGVTEVTLRSRYKELKKKLNIKFENL
ncbi:MAG: transcription initiation factor IIB [Promethearchaeota archaeon]|nr:MAG: transcription initiation factor IIB [Candidatus Lokiarchaeota archaeon]